MPGALVGAWNRVLNCLYPQRFTGRGTDRVLWTGVILVAKLWGPRRVSGRGARWSLHQPHQRGGRGRSHGLAPRIPLPPVLQLFYCLVNHWAPWLESSTDGSHCHSLFIFAALFKRWGVLEMKHLNTKISSKYPYFKIFLIKFLSKMKLYIKSFFFPLAENLSLFSKIMRSI